MSDQSQQEQEASEWQQLVEDGNSACRDRRYTEAELKFAAALRIAEKWAAPGKEARSENEATSESEAMISDRLAKSLNNMAALYHIQGKYKMAEDLFNRCLDIRLKRYGEEHLDVAVSLHNLAALHSAKRRWVLAEPLYRRSLEIREKLLGEEHPELISILSNFALMLRRTQREEEAKQLESRVQQITESAAAAAKT